MMYLLDTNVVIYYANRDADAIRAVRDALAPDTPLSISVISEVELFSFADLSTAEARAIEEVLETLTIIPLDSGLARRAAFVRALCGTSLADSIIAATALATGATLLTRNVKDFKNIPRLSVMKI